MKTVSKIVIVLTVILFGACQNKEFTQVKNDGRVIVLDGQGNNDTIVFKGVGCVENITDTALFNALIKESSERTKRVLNFPLSYNPTELELIVTKEDSLFNFADNKKFENTYKVISKLNYIAKNAFGTEMEGEYYSSYYVVNNKITDISEKIKLEDLKFNEEGIINRTLNLYSVGSTDHIELMPTDRKTYIVSSSISCIDKGAWLVLHLEKNNEIKLVSWNDFNCDGTSYFRSLDEEQIQILKTYKLDYITLTDDNSIVCSVPENESDYFIQLMKLLYQ